MRTAAESIAAAEARAFALRRHMRDVCTLAGIHQSVWSRAKSKGRIRIATLKKVEDTLDWMEREVASKSPTSAAAE